MNQQTLTKNITQSLTGNLTNVLPGIIGATVVGGLAPALSKITAQTAPAVLTQAATEGVCNSTKPGGCMANSLGGLKAGIGDIINQAGQAGLAAQMALNQAVTLSKLEAIFATLTAFQTFVTGKFTALWSSNVIDRALGLMNLATNLHNATMLSNNLVVTLESTMTNILGTIGLKDADKNPYDVATIINTSVTNMIKSAIGVANYNKLTLEWKQANRIYQATSNLLSTLQSIQYALQDTINTLGQYTGKIGNALIKFGLLPEKAYDWMNEKFDLKVGRLGALERATKVLEGATVIASDLEQVSSSALEIKQNIDEIKGQKKELDDSFKAVTDKKKEDETKAKSDSASPTIADADTIKPE